MQAFVLGALGAAAVLVVIAMLALLERRMSGADEPRPARTVLWPAGLGVVVAAVLLPIFGIRMLGAAFLAPLAALGGLFGFLVTAALRQDRVVLSSVVSSVLTAAVYVPVTVLVLGGVFDPLASGAGIVDLGGAVPGLVAAGAAGAAVRVLRRRQRAGVHLRAGWWATLWPTLIAWIAWIAWLVGFNLGIGAVVITIVQNAIAMPVAGALASAIVQRARYRHNTPAGVATGILAGLAAATPACANLQLPLAIVTAFVSGLLCGILVRPGGYDGPRLLLGVALLGGGLSTVLLGFFMRAQGFIYAGQPEPFFAQAEATLGAAVYGFAVAAVLWLAIAGIRRSRGGDRGAP